MPLSSVRRFISDHSTNKEVRHLNDELVAARHAVALNRSAATAAAVASLRASNAAAGKIGVDGGAALPAVGSSSPPKSSVVNLVFKGNRVFVFRVVSPEMPVQLECIRFEFFSFNCFSVNVSTMWNLACGYCYVSLVSKSHILY